MPRRDLTYVRVFRKDGQPIPLEEEKRLIEEFYKTWDATTSTNAAAPKASTSTQNEPPEQI